MIKRLTNILCIAACLTFSTHSFAAAKRYFPFRFEYAGIEDLVIQKNVTATLENYRNSLNPLIPPKTGVAKKSKTGGVHDFMLSSAEIHRFVRKASGLIQTAVEPYGYFRSHIHARLIRTPKARVAQFVVTLGPVLPIRSVQVDVQGAGQFDPEYHALLANPPFHVGDGLQTEQYENLKVALYNLATERGYFRARMVKSRIRINLLQYYARVIIIFDTGPRFRFGPTTFTSTPFNEVFLRKYLTYCEGHYYNAKKLEETQEAFVASNYFNQVTPVFKSQDAVNDEVPIHIKLIPRKAKQYLLGLGYGSDTGVRGTIGLTLRHLGHHGHRFQTLLRASQTNSSLVARYVIPGPNPARDHFTIGTGVSNLEQSTGNARNARFGVNYTYLSKHWKNSIMLAYLTERYNMPNLPFTSTQLVYPNFDSKYMNADHLKHPRKGISIELQLAGADKSLLSQTSFFQTQLHLRTLYTIDATRTRLLFRSDYGYTNIAQLTQLPLSLQLYAGGSRSVRGYGYNSIGVFGSNLPGRNLVVGSAEVQQRVMGSVYLAGFIDAGVVANTNIFYHVNAGTGPGIAYISPIGTLELTFAQAFTQSNKPWTVQFTMGTAL